MSRFKFLIKYIKYRLSAKTRYAVHSPFVFAFLNEIIRDKKNYYAYDKLEPIRSNLLNNKTPLQIEDLGAGSKLGTKTRTVQSIAKTSVMSEKNASLLFRIVKSNKSENILELGTCLGLTSMYLASANTTATVTTIEGAELLHQFAKDLFTENHYKNINAIHGNFDSILPEYLSRIKQIDFALIDGNHRKIPTLTYFEELIKKSHNNTILIFDDIHWSEEMEEAWKIICDDKRVTVSIDLFFLGIIFFKKELQKEHFVLRF